MHLQNTHMTRNVNCASFVATHKCNFYTCWAKHYKTKIACLPKSCCSILQSSTGMTELNTTQYVLQVNCQAPYGQTANFQLVFCHIVKKTSKIDSPARALDDKMVRKRPYRLNMPDKQVSWTLRPQNTKQWNLSRKSIIQGSTLSRSINEKSEINFSSSL